MKKLLYLVLMLALVGCGSREPAAKKENMQAGPAGSASKEAEADLYIREGTKLLAQGDIPQAIVNFDNAIKSDPTDPRGYFVLGEMYMRLNRYDRAIDTFSAILNFEPNNGQAYYLTAIAQGMDGNRDKAVEYAQRSVEIFQEEKDQENFIKALSLLQSLTINQNQVGQ